MTRAAAPTAAPSPRRASNLRPYPSACCKTDADVYAEIARAWWLMCRQGEHPAHPMRMHLVAPGFAEEVWGRDDVDPHDVIAVCARIVSWEDYGLLQRQAMQTQLCKGLREALDPVSSWWHPLTNSPELGIHFWTHVLVPVELQCIGRVDDPPPLRYGRFAKRDAQGPARLSVIPTDRGS